KSGDSILIKKLAQEKYAYFIHAPEWYKVNKDVLVYHTITDTWIKVDEYPYPGPAGAPMVKAGNSWYVINGEIKPGVRSPKVYRGTEKVEARFGLFNWGLLVFYLLGMLYLGYFFMKRENTTEDFFKGGERIPWWAAGMSIFATMLSAITFMAIPAKTYATDWRYYLMAVTIFIMAIPVVKYYLPFFRRLKITTAYEYLEVRFNYTSRLLASTIFIVFQLARTGLVLFLPSLALTTVTGIDIYTCIVLMGVITIIYCTMGGVEAVIWGDVIQGFVLMGGALLAVVFLVSGTEGGITKLIEVTVEHEKIKIFNMAFSLSSATFWVVILGGIANNLIIYSSDQTVIQRYLTTKDEKSAAKSIYLNGILSIIISIVFYFIGTALFAFYKTNPDQLNVSMANPDSIFPHFIMTKMPQGIAGILIAAIFAATMSTVSTSINSLSTAFTTDFYRKFVKNKLDRHYLFIARLSGIIFGGIGIGLALFMAMSNILSLFDYFNYILGLLASGLGGLFFMGIFIPRIKGNAAIIGFIGGFIAVLITKTQTDIHLMLYGFIGMVSTVIIGLLASMLIPEKVKPLEGLTIKSLKSE
ncbi:MAG: sodium/solute symporter, partial [Cyclobacteriaceae bacterium]|nr:sodium/solute symporter [Cyclobacteriaceae bacterium]